MPFDPYKNAQETLRRLAEVGVTYVRGRDDNRFDCCSHLIFSHPDGESFEWQGSWWQRESVQRIWDWAKARFPVDDSDCETPL